LAILPSVIFAFVASRQADAEARERATAQLESIATIKTNNIDRWVESGHTILRLALLVEDAEYTESDESLESEAVTDPEIIEREAEEFRERLELQDVFTEFFVYDPEGIILYSSEVVRAGQSVASEPYYAESLTNFRVEVPYYDAEGQLTIIFTERILDEDDEELVGVFAGRANPALLEAIMVERTGLGASGETYLVSAQNNYFLTPSRFEGYPQNQAYQTTGIDQALAGQNGVGEYQDYRGQQVIGAYRWLPELELALMAEIDEAEALRVGRDLRQQSLITAGILALIGLVLGLGAAQALTGPLQKLTRSAQAIAAGNYQQRVGLRANNEVGRLSETFDFMAEQLSQKISELDSRVEELNATNQALKVATTKAKESSRLKSEFLATMSHELRTPLNAMEGFTSIMLARMGGAEYNAATEHYLQRIDTNNKRLLSLINDFLDISRIESGRLQLVQSPIELPKLVRQWQEQVSVLADKKGLQLEVYMDAKLPKVIYGDEEALSKIAFNLLSNAVKFTEAGKVSLRLAKDGDRWTLQVEDSGIGIPPHAQEYIFEEFRQVDQSSKRKYGGTGLGLAIVQKLARLMDGSIHLNSELGRGSTFTLTLPLITSQPREFNSTSPT
jgi:signal transduction histidine kinase